MKLDLPAGKYVAAVSGGVDSMVLLDLQRQTPDIELVVAHFDHGIRDDSAKDSELVANIAAKYGAKFELGQGKLGAGASEDKARVARYKFLQNVKDKHKADYIITAHHQDDLIETALLNTLRGTGRRGMTSIADNINIKRPLLHMPKTEIIKYAKVHGLVWNEDSTNIDDTYLRNYLRRHVLTLLTDMQREKLLQNIQNITSINKELNSLIATLSQDIKRDDFIDRQKFSMLPQEVANELIIFWLRSNGVEYDKKLARRLSLALKTARAGTSHDVTKGVKLVVSKDKAHFTPSITARLV